MKLINGENKNINNCTIWEIYNDINYNHPRTTSKDRNFYNLIKLWKDAHAGFNMKNDLYYLGRYYEKVYKEHYKNQ